MKNINNLKNGTICFFLLDQIETNITSTLIYFFTFSIVDDNKRLFQF